MSPEKQAVAHDDFDALASRDDSLAGGVLKFVRLLGEIPML